MKNILTVSVAKLVWHGAFFCSFLTLLIREGEMCGIRTACSRLCCVISHGISRQFFRITELLLVCFGLLLPSSQGEDFHYCGTAGEHGIAWEGLDLLCYVDMHSLKSAVSPIVIEMGLDPEEGWTLALQYSEERPCRVLGLLSPILTPVNVWVPSDCKEEFEVWSDLMDDINTDYNNCVDFVKLSVDTYMNQASGRFAQNALNTIQDLLFELATLPPLPNQLSNAIDDALPKIEDFPEDSEDRFINFWARDPIFDRKKYELYPLGILSTENHSAEVQNFDLESALRDLLVADFGGEVATLTYTPPQLDSIGPAPDWISDASFMGPQEITLDELIADTNALCDQFGISLDITKDDLYDQFWDDGKVHWELPTGETLGWTLGGFDEYYAVTYTESVLAGTVYTLEDVNIWYYAPSGLPVPEAYGRIQSVPGELIQGELNLGEDFAEYKKSPNKANSFSNFLTRKQIQNQSVKKGMFLGLGVGLIEIGSDFAICMHEDGLTMDGAISEILDCVTERLNKINHLGSPPCGIVAPDSRSTLEYQMIQDGRIPFPPYEKNEPGFFEWLTDGWLR